MSISTTFGKKTHVEAFYSVFVFRRNMKWSTLVVVGLLPLLGSCKYDTIYLTQKLDNFGFGNTDTFKLRVLVSDEHWNSSNGPIFFYTGNEGSVTDFADNTGFMWDIASEFQAMIVFAEHRYYGESLPNVNQSLNISEYYKYLSTEQVLADFANVIWYLKTEYIDASHSALIAFGGSYGAELAVWMRIKYPHLVQGVIASSAPLWGDRVHGKNCAAKYRVVTKAYERRSEECKKNIRRSWDVINHFNQTDAGKEFLSDIFHLCTKISTDNDLITFKNTIVSAFFIVAMVDYPTHSNLMKPLPSYPTKEICKSLSNSSMENDELMEALYEAISIYYNYTGDLKCLQINESSLDDASNEAWNYQACSELPDVECTDGIHDMFEPYEWNYQQISDECFQTYGVRPNNVSLSITYGKDNFLQVGNIVFSNGEFDPWSADGINHNLSDSVISIWIKDSAHHLDLRSYSPEDPPSVIEARNIEKHYIKKWIHQWNQRNLTN